MERVRLFLSVRQLIFYNTMISFYGNSDFIEEFGLIKGICNVCIKEYFKIKIVYCR